MIKPMHDHLNIMNEKLLNLGFCGSYRPFGQDVLFLLKKEEVQTTDVAEKERLIQSGVHYSKMISPESAPSEEHLKHYKQALEIGSIQLANDVQKLGNSLMERFADQPIVLVSLIRAGVPLGVLLKKHISKTQPCYHYGVSIIRGRGIDHAALSAIIKEHGAKNLVFVDGWIGKGAISKELTQSVQSYPDLFDKGWDIPRLVALSDLGGGAWLTANFKDWLIPSGLLGSVISGLVSRSLLLNEVDEEVAKNDCYNSDLWHRCAYFDHLKEHDKSIDFIDAIFDLMQKKPIDEKAICCNIGREKQALSCANTIQWIAKEYGVDNVNLIKPSIAEATRAVLRRVPERILVNDPTDPNVQLLLHFASENNVPVDVLADKIGSYKAVTIIKKIKS